MGWLTQIWGRLRGAILVLWGSYPFERDQYVAQIERVLGQTAQTRDMLLAERQQLLDTVLGQASALQIQKDEADETYRNGLVTIASLLTHIGGGEVRVGIDIIQAVAASDFTINHNNDGEHVVLTLTVHECDDDCQYNEEESY
jgi:hypothetical protein